MKILHVVGARPNFMKAQPVVSSLESIPEVEQILVHTGQHYDRNMSRIFFEQLELKEPDVNLEVGSASHSLQTAEIMIRLERFLLERSPQLVLVYGDVNSTLAAALVCAKIGIPIGHVEAGLRSFDRSMPEEINRLLTDQVSDLHFTPSVDGNENLLTEGVSAKRIHFVGNVMIDTLVRLLPRAESFWPKLADDYGLDSGSFGIVTLHRPSNADDPNLLARIINALAELSESLPLLFPIHPRTEMKLKNMFMHVAHKRLIFLEPLGYLEFLCLQKNAALVITDSGGIQEETSFLNVPCITMRENTERPVTVKSGSNYLVGQDIKRLNSIFHLILAGNAKQACVPPLWDGHAGQRIASIIGQYISLPSLQLSGR
jgi:UDP-N-acetylglucosamine 2-epimerase (non-hydrolysing)